MPLTLTDKQAVVAEVAETASNAISALAADYRGLTVSEMTELRAKANEVGVHLRVVRNTLARRALENTEFSCMREALVGPLFLLFSQDSLSAPARLVRDFSKEHDNLEVKVLSISGKLLGPEALESIAKLPTKDEAISKLLFVLKAPITQFVRTLAEPVAKLTRTIAAIRDQKT